MTAAADPRVAMLAELREPAFRLAKALAAAAEAAPRTDARWLDYVDAFNRCCFSVRVSIALELRLEREGHRIASAEPRTDREDLTDREVLADREDANDERPERYTERDRDRETERASFPILIRALERVAADAAALPGPEPAELPTLRELLARLKAQPPPVAAAPKAAPGLKARLAVAGAAPPITAERRPASNVAEVLAARRATGPPRR